MRAGSDSGKFDLSDVGADSLDDVLSVAAEIQYEYGLCQGNTRIERLARYLALNLGEVQERGYDAPQVTAECSVPEQFMVGVPPSWLNRYHTPTEARMLAAMLVRAAERAER